MKKAASVFGIAFTIIIGCFYLLSCLTPYLSPVHFPFLTIVSILYLPILIIYGVVMIAWLFVSKRIFIALLLLLFMGYKNLSSTVGTNYFATSWSWKKDSGNIRI